MQRNIDRARELVPALILTQLSMIQALALEFFWSKVGASEFLWHWSWEAVIGWLQLAVMLEGILLIWVMYVSFVLRFSWLPALEETLLPFLIGLLEFAMIDLTEPGLVGPWLVVLACIFILALFSSHTTFKRAARDPSNAYFFSRVDVSRGWRAYPHTGALILLLLASGLGLWLTDPSPWLVLAALTLAIGAMSFQYLQMRSYWLHSLTPEPES